MSTIRQCDGAKREMRRPVNCVTLALLGAVFCAMSGSAQDLDKLLKASADFNAVQLVYQQAVPHTDKNGNVLLQYDPTRSFFQIGIWGNPFGESYGHTYDLQVLKDAGFNTMWPWPHRGLELELEQGAKSGLQVVHMRPLDVDVASKYKDHSNWLGNVWVDEPTGSFWGKNMEGKYQEFLAYKAKLNTAAPGRVVFINDVPWVAAPATSWWVKWNTAGDVACHDNYPVMVRKHRSRTLGDEGVKTGIPTTVSLAAAVNQERKPVWLIVGAFSQRVHGAFPFRFPSPMQLRAQVYAGLIHGATGIIYFCWDTYVCRDGGVVGMSHDPKTAYLKGGPGRPHPTPIKPVEIAEAKALWMTATAINAELKTLTPSLFSPTVPNEVKYSLTTEGEPVSATPVRCLLKPHPERGYVLLTVNLDDAVIKVTYQFPAGLASVQPLFEERLPLGLKADSQTFEDMYDPFEVHVYHVVP